MIEEIKEKLNRFPMDLEIEWENQGSYNIKYNLNCKLYLNVIDLFSYYGYKNCDFYNEYYSNFIELLKIYNDINNLFEKEEELIDLNKLDSVQIMIFFGIKGLFKCFPKNMKFNEETLVFEYIYGGKEKIYLNINDLIVNNDDLHLREDGIRLGRLLNLIIYFINSFKKIF